MARTLPLGRLIKEAKDLFKPLDLSLRLALVLLKRRFQVRRLGSFRHFRKRGQIFFSA